MQKRISRRRFICYGCSAAAGLAGWPIIKAMTRDSAMAADNPSDRREALFWEKGEDDRVRCQLCFRSCDIAAGERGYCGVRVNYEGVLYTLVFGNLASVTFGPVEKKPLHHYLPGAQANNYGTAGCNLHCKFCHNWHLSRRRPEELSRTHSLTPREAVKRAEDEGVSLISFTYNEPTVFYEFMLETAELARGKGLGINVNSNAMIKEKPLRRLMRHTDCTTIDLKAFSEDFYREVCGGSLSQVLENIKIMKELGVLVEVVNLVIPGLNDDAAAIRSMCRWLRENAGEDTPLHLNRFSPAYKLTDISPTPVSTLEEALHIATEEGLQYVYIGNVSCGSVL